MSLIDSRVGTVLRSKIDTNSDDYRANLAQMQALWDEVADQMAQVPTIGGQRYVDRHRKRGKMLVRERVEALIDPDTPFLELSPLAAWGTQDPIGVGVVDGIGIVEGVECAITGTDMSVKGGASNPTTWKKQQRIFEIARANRLPMINLNESAGADTHGAAAGYDTQGTVTDYDTDAAGYGADQTGYYDDQQGCVDA